MTDERTLLRGRIPKHFINSIDGWVEHGVKPSGLLRIIITNNLFLTFSLALDNPKLLGVLPDIIVYFANHTPAECWGSEQALEEWRGTVNREH